MSTSLGCPSEACGVGQAPCRRTRPVFLRFLLPDTLGEGHGPQVTSACGSSKGAYLGRGEASIQGASARPACPQRAPALPWSRDSQLPHKGQGAHRCDGTSQPQAAPVGGRGQGGGRREGSTLGENPPTHLWLRAPVERRAPALGVACGCHLCPLASLCRRPVAAVLRLPGCNLSTRLPGRCWRRW